MDSAGSHEYYTMHFLYTTSPMAQPVASYRTFPPTVFPHAFVPSSLHQSAPSKLHRRISIILALLTFLSIAYWIVQAMLPEQAKLQGRGGQPALGDVGSPANGSRDVKAPLRTAGRHILDADRKRIKLVSVNWYGASDILFAPMGLDVRHRSEIASTIRKMGFNSVRFPYSDQMVIQNPIVDPVYLSANLDLLDRYDSAALAEGTSGPRALEVYQATVEAMTDAGVAVIINNHITNAHWCDGKNLCDASWKNDHYGPICSIKQTTESWIANWRTIMAPHIHNPLVIGADLRNEPRGLWGTMTWNMWATAAEQASEALLSLQPNWLMFVEGVSSANDCSGARKRPVQLSVPNRVVYSSHVYKWSGWSSLVPYSKRAYGSFASDMKRNWAYLLEENIAPVWVGEFGITHYSDLGDQNYWQNLMRYLHETDADWGYWALNPRKPEQYDDETYGLLKDDWLTPVADFRMEDLKKLMGS